MRQWVVTVGLIVLLAGAGCTTLVPDEASVSTIDQRSKTTIDDQTVDTTDTHPFADEMVAVTVDGTARERALLADGLTYWERQASEYAGFDVSFRLVEASEPTDPDVHVQFVDRVRSCGDREVPAGCAPRLNASTAFDRPASVSVQSGLANDSTRLVVRHEVGHLLGLRHGDDPRAVMRHGHQLTSIPQPNATERPIPWSDSTVTVAIRNASVDSAELGAYHAEVAYGLAYFREGADGTVPSNLTISMSDDPATADVVVSSVDSSACRDGPGSCVSLEGTDPDGDGAIETYTRAEIELVDLDIEATSWHVARQFAVAVGVTGDELPERLRGIDPTERRDDWHG